MNRLSGKVAIITGAASGQGAAESVLFAAEGARVVLTDVNDLQGGEVAKYIGKTRMFLHHDVTDPTSWNAVAATTLETFGGIDILINNAGVYVPKAFQRLIRIS